MKGLPVLPGRAHFKNKLESSRSHLQLNLKSRMRVGGFRERRRDVGPVVSECPGNDMVIEAGSNPGNRFTSTVKHPAADGE